MAEPADHATEQSPLWHTLRADDALHRLDTSPEGLSSAEAEQRLQRYGPNRLPEPPRRSALARFASQFHNVLIYVLLLAALATAMLGHWTDTWVIVGVVLINALIGFVQEGKAEQAIESIRKSLSPHATVRREGRRIDLDAQQLVPGDVVFLQSGDKVPADLRLFHIKDLQIEEAALTGESVPAIKSLDPAEPDAVPGDRLCIAFSGTIVARGQGEGVVVATGEATEIGRISGMLADVQVLTTPLLRKIAQFGRWLTAAIAVVTVAAFLIGWLTHDRPAEEVFLACVGIAVAAIPEGLPAIITITLAIGVRRMAQRNAIIRRLPAVETLGAVTVICSDKTGTLTRNEMTAQAVALGGEILEVEGAGYRPEGRLLKQGREIEPRSEPTLIELCRAGVLCNDASLVQSGERWECRGDPTEGALLTLGGKFGVDRDAELQRFAELDKIPFESEYQYMATLHREPEGGGVIYLKGAPERLLEMCQSQQSPGGPQPLDAALWQGQMDQIAQRGQRVLALAQRAVPPSQRGIGHDDVRRGMVLLGLVGIHDPPREEATRAVRLCLDAGVRVKMVTGDHAATARAIGASMSIGDGTQALTGQELAALDDETLRRRVAEVDVFARVSPEHKLRLVKALQANGEVVAMTGDGVNDAPALKRADVGVAMGISGTEAAKEASEMVLADDNFASIAKAVAEGRTVYDNIRKSILFILPTNAAEAMVVIAAVITGTALPITPVQILWVNMITAVSLALSLAFEPPERNVMRRPPRPPAEPILTGFLLWRIAFVAILMLIATLGIFLDQRRDGADLALARTYAVNMLVMLEAAYLLNSRFILDPALTVRGLTGNPIVLIAIACVITLQMLFTYAPFMQAIFDTVALPPAAWIEIHVLAIGVFLLVELEKTTMRRFRKDAH